MAEDTTKKILRYLNDAYASEVGAMKSMEHFLVAATDPQLKAAISDHLTETQGHADRLTSRILALGGDKSEPKAIIDQIIAMGSEITNAFHDGDDKQTQDLIKSVSLEAFEIATYTALREFATAVNDDETASIADSILDEEKKAYDKLLSLIPQVATRAADQVSVNA